MSIYHETRKSIKRINFSINKFFSRLAFSQDSFLLILGGLTGILAGLGAIVFHEAIHFIKHTFFDSPGGLFGEHSLLGSDNIYAKIIIVLIPAVGGLLVGLLAHFFEKGEEGEGIPNVIDAVASKGGVIKGTIAIKKIIGSALSIGTGGAGGKEGPVVQIGSSIASAFGQFFFLSSDRLRILVGCGAAAGLSAAFNAPLGGALFAMEIILRTFRAKTFSPILISSVFATALSRGFLGQEPAFVIPKYSLINNYELGFYVIFGLLCGLAAVYFVKVFYLIEDFWHKHNNIPKYIKPAIGGIMVGLIGLFLPGVYGWSYTSMDSALAGTAPILILLALLFVKPIATALTIGSGGNGGTFAPSLFTGAMLGGIFGQLINLIFPEMQVNPGAYALVGMGAVVAGTTQASLTALIMVFEMSDNYKIILPLMLTIIIARTLSKSILKGDLYSLNFSRRGKEIDIYGRKTSILKNLSVKDLIDKDIDVVDQFNDFAAILEKIKKSKYNTLVVRNNQNCILGQISFRDIRDTLIDEDTKAIRSFLIAEDVMTKNITSIKSDSNCEDALNTIETGDYEFLPVVDKEKKLLGVISRTDILQRYKKEVFIKNQAELED